MRLYTSELVKKYKARTVVDHVSIDVNQGEIVGLLGPNGAGKTTTFYMIVGLIKPNEGRIFLEDDEGKVAELTKEPVYKRAQMGVGYLAQEASVFRRLSVEDNIRAVLEMTTFSKEYQNERVEALIEAVGEDRVGRAAGVRREIDFVLERREETELLLKLHAEGAIPERITHNDTKSNNLLIDDLTGEGICVLDLDTVMPGLSLYDFGDMVRGGTSPAEEDEVNLAKVGMRFEMFEALLQGFLSSAGDFLTAAERENLPFSGKLITLETGIRFLTDYINGDLYFKTRRPNHNLERCRNQFRLVESIEHQMNRMLSLL